MIDRYHRQKILPGVGVQGQAKLSTARVAVVGCGALGGTIADQLVRAGTGWVDLIDRDVVEFTNLQRQVLFDEADVGTPKAEAAKRRLSAVNSTVKIEAHAVDLHSGNIESILGTSQGRAADLILDGTDNAETRYLVNDVAVKHGIPWVYGGCVGMDGRVMTIVPGKTACLCCVFPTPPAVGELQTCDTVGVLGPAAAVVAALQATAAIKLLIGGGVGELLVVDVWNGRLRKIDTDVPSADCPCCGRGIFEFLDRPVENQLAALCGRETVQVRPAKAVRLELADVEKRLTGLGKASRSAFMVRCELTEESGIVLTVFNDGRCLVGGTSDVSRARAIVARLMG